MSTCHMHVHCTLDKSQPGMDGTDGRLELMTIDH